MEFEEWEGTLRAYGEQSGAYKDLSLAFVEVEGQAFRAMDLINHFSGGDGHLHNFDFLQPAIYTLGSYLQNHAGHSFDYINNFRYDQEALREKLESNDVLTVAVTTTFYVTAQPIIEIVNFVRDHNPDAKIILGGPYIAGQIAQNDLEVLTNLFIYFDADFWVHSSEGEQTLACIIDVLKEGGDIGSIPNIVYLEEDELVQTELETERNELPENPPAWEAFGESMNSFTSIRTAKSCPFSCAFCGFPQRAGKYLYMDVDLVEAELNRLQAQGVQTLTFLDDTFNVPKKRFRELLRMMVRNKYDFKWNSFFRCDFGDEEIIDLMAESGCEGVFLGLESGSDTVLKVMNKSLRAKHVERMVPLLKQAGIISYASFIVGFPGETRETFEETMDLIERVEPDYFRTQLWYCDPMTPIWQEREQWEIEGAFFNWRHKTMDFEEACSLIDHAFLNVRNSIWLPQDSFEIWSLFYLQRHGFTRRQIDDYLQSFRLILAKQKLISEGPLDTSKEVEHIRAILQGKAGENGTAAPMDFSSQIRILQEQHSF